MASDAIKALQSKIKDELLTFFITNVTYQQYQDLPDNLRNMIFTDTVCEELIKSFDEGFYEALQEYEYDPVELYEKMLRLEWEDPDYFNRILERKEVSILINKIDEITPEVMSMILSYTDTESVKNFCLVSPKYTWLCSSEGWELILREKDPILYQAWRIVNNEFNIPAEDLFNHQEVAEMVSDIEAYLSGLTVNISDIVRTAVVHDYFDIFQSFMPSVQIFTEPGIVFEGFYEMIYYKQYDYLDYLFDKIKADDVLSRKLVLHGLAQAVALFDTRSNMIDVIVYFLNVVDRIYQDLAEEDKNTLLGSIFDLIDYELIALLKSLYQHRAEAPIIDLIFERYGELIVNTRVDDLELVQFMVEEVQKNYHHPFITVYTLKQAVMRDEIKTFEYLLSHVDTYQDLRNFWTNAPKYQELLMKYLDVSASDLERVQSDLEQCPRCKSVETGITNRQSADDRAFYILDCEECGLVMYAV